MPLLYWIISNVILALVLAVAALIAQRWLARPALAHILWVLVLVKLVTPPLVSVPLGQSPGSITCALGACGCDHHSQTQTFVRDVVPGMLLATWSIGAGTTVWLAYRRWFRFQRLMVHAHPAPAEWQSQAAGLASELSIRCPPEVLTVPGRLPPLVIPGRFRPRILLPDDLLDQLTASQRSALLLHELVHIQRGDHRVRLLEFAVGVVYWWVPFIGSIGRQLRACEETCCDAAVVTQLPESRRDYARLLLDVIDFADPSPGQAVPQATAMSAVDNLERRLRAILDPTQGRRSPLAGAVVVGVAIAILPCELHYDFTRRPVPAMTHEPAAADTLPPGEENNRVFLKDVGCPS